MKDNESIYKALIKKDLNGLKKLTDLFTKNLNPLNPRTQVLLHQDNMTGAAMIGIYANHNANHALM